MNIMSLHWFIIHQISFNEFLLKKIFKHLELTFRQLLKNDKKEASKITNEIQTQLEVLSTLEQDSDLLNDILVSCQMVKEKAIGYIENAMQQEHTSVELSKLMELLDSLNTTLQSYQLTAK